jgi:serine/threonine protein kinase
LIQELAEQVGRLPLGPYRIIRPLQAGKLAPRWLAVHDRDQTSHVAHEFVCRDRAEQRRFLTAFEKISELDHPHIVHVEQFALADGRLAWLLTPYTGNQEGLVTLEALRVAKGGRMPPQEAERAVTQLLSAVEYAHGRGHHHGPIGLEEILVDRHGRVSIDLYGLERRLGELAPGNAEVVRDEVRSVVETGYRLLTGLSAEEPRIAVGRLIRKLDPHWDEWFDAGLDPLSGGFASAAEAAAALPSVRRDALRAPAAGVRTVLGRVRMALRQGS